MKRIRILKAWAGCLACCGMLLPMPAIQAAATDQTTVSQPGMPAKQVIDVELRGGGLLLGQVVGPAGKPLVGTRVSLRRLDREVATTVTDPSGYFFARGLRGGTYEIIAGPTRQLYRLWAPGTAPPTAGPGALIVVGGHQVRGQTGPTGYWLSNPWVIAGIVAAAVAVPVAIHNNRIDRLRSP